MPGYEGLNTPENESYKVTIKFTVEEIDPSDNMAIYIVHRKLAEAL